MHRHRVCMERRLRLTIADEPPRSPRRKYGSRSRSRSPTKARRRSRTPPRRPRDDREDGVRRDTKHGSKNGEPSKDDPDTGMIDPEEEVGDDEVEKQMQAMLGFGGFGTTKETKVLGNDVFAVRKEKKMEYRQYMYVEVVEDVGGWMCADIGPQESDRRLQSSSQSFVSFSLF